MTASQAWLYLLLAIGCEITGTGLLKLSEGLTRPWPTAFLLAAYACAIALVPDKLFISTFPYKPDSTSPADHPLEKSERGDRALSYRLWLCISPQPF